MNERTYKQAFVISAVICLVLAGTLAYVFWGRGRVAPATDDASPVMAKGPDVRRNRRVAPCLPPVHLYPSLRCNFLRSGCRQSV